jgi:hypothetical protein
LGIIFWELKKGGIAGQLFDGRASIVAFKRFYNKAVDFFSITQQI